MRISTHIPIGKIGDKYEQMNAASNSLGITRNGDSVHGAYPSNGTDAIQTAIETIVSRNVDSTETAVITIGVISKYNCWTE